ncbi:MAG TPA: hypothetical protein DCL44_05140 [Elusimicrobia bacterium]|nr:hypothetical protein [Elusimicrobiota bacterium]
MSAGSVRAAEDAGLPGEYLNYTGYRALGMGRAYTALADGPDALCWNPAGLGYLRPNTISMTHTRTMEEFNLDSIFYAQPVFKKGAFGVGYIRQDSGRLIMTDDLNRAMGRYSDVQETAVMGYGVSIINKRSSKKLLHRLAIGSTIKYSRQSLYNVKAGGWGLDAGILAKLKYNLSLGIRVQNLVAPTLKYETASDKFPRSVVMGLALTLWGGQVIAAVDAGQALGVTQKLKCNIGAEGTLWKILKLRAGYDLSNRESIFGFGYTFGRSEAAYAANVTAEGPTQNAGFSYEFGGFPVTITANPEVFSPVGLKKSTTFTVKINPATRIYSWTLYIKDQDGNVARSFRGNGSPPGELTWDGSTQGGSMVAASSYIYTMEVTNAEGKKETTPSQVIRVVYGTPLDRL